MTSRLLGLVLAPLIATSIFAATGAVTRSRGPALPPTRPEQQDASSPSQELADAAKLDADVLKLYKEGKFEEAIPLAKRVLKIREKLLPANDRLLATSLSNLGLLYLARLKVDDADSLLKRALSIYEQTPAGNALVTAQTLDSLAQVRLLKSDVKKATEFYLKALSIKETTLNSDHEEILYSLNNLLDLYVSQKEVAKAKAMLKRIISRIERKLGDSDTQVGRLLERMACLMYRNDEKDEAEKVEARANHILYSDQATKPDPIWLPKEVFSCKLIHNPRPDFMSIVGVRRPTARFTMDVAIETDEAGNVTAARYIGGDPVFKSVAEKAALNAKLRPTIVDGRAVKVEGVISHQFMTMTRTVMVAVPGGVMGRP
ncbi:MAG: tetratricopeptide repeat protein [Pyrinomonadaceae bacterium]